MRPISVILLITLFLFSCRTPSSDSGNRFDPDAEYIQIVLFHLAQRCESCEAVEAETKMLLEEEYWKAFATGKVKFISLDYQSENGKEASRLLRSSGQTLYVVKGDSVTNLTSPAFMYASTHPDYYREALREELDKYLN